MSRIPLPLGVLISLGVAGPAGAVVMDFDAASVGAALMRPYEEDGFRIAVQGGSANHYDIEACAPEFGQACGNAYITFDNYSGLFDSNVRLSRADGGLFDLLGFDVYRADTTLVAVFPLVTETIEPCALRCQIRSSNGGLAGFAVGQMNFMAPEWRDVAWIEFAVPPGSSGPDRETTFVKIDNIGVAPSPVPAPSSLLLLVTGLGALIARRHNRRASLT